MTGRLIGIIGLGLGLVCAVVGRAEATCVGLNCSCSVATGDHSFGVYDPLSGLASDSTSLVQVTCSAFILSGSVAYEITLGTGQSGTYGARRLSQGSAELGYNLYTGADRSAVWGDGTGGSSSVSDSYSLAQSPSTRQYTIYGRVPGDQIVPAGTYTDMIVVTVIY